MDRNKLYELVEKLQEQAEEQAARSAILITLNELNTFAQKHFASEERYLMTMRSLELRPRKSLHQKLMEQLTEHTEDFKEAPTARVSKAFLGFLQAWIQVHGQTANSIPEADGGTG